MNRLVFVAAAALLTLSACGQKVDTKAEAVSGEELARYSDHVKDKVDLGKDSGLVQLFCLHSTGAKCADGIEAKLKEYGFEGSGTTLDLANAMVKIYADAHDKTPDQYSSDEDFLAAAYQVVLGRAPDPTELQQCQSILSAQPAEKGVRKLLWALLTCAEFQVNH